MFQEKRNLIAIVLIGLLMVGYIYYLSTQKKPEQQPQPQQTAQQQQQAQQAQTQRTQQQPQQQAQRQQVRRTAPAQRVALGDRFEPLGPGVNTPAQARAYLQNQDRINSLKEQIKKLERKLNLSTSQNERKFLKNRIKGIEAQIKRALPGTYNGVSTQDTFIDINTDVYTGKISTRGAIFDTLFYKKFKAWDRKKKKHVLMKVLNDNGDPSKRKLHPLLISFNENGMFKHEMPIYTFDKAESERLTKKSNNKIISKVFYIRYYNKGGIFKLVKTIKFHKEKYIIDLGVKIINETRGENTITASTGSSDVSYYLFWGTGLGQFVQKKYRTSYDNEIRLSYYNYVNKDITEIKSNKQETVRIFTKDTKASWIGLDNRYFFVALNIKDNNDRANSRQLADKYSKVNFAILKREQPNFRETLTLAFNKMALNQAGDARESIVRVYLGPKKKSLLSNIQHLNSRKKIEGLEIVTEKGFILFRIIGIGINWLLMLINSLIGNFAISIILLTILIKIVLHPLNKKSTESVKKMQVIQPKIQEINKQYAKQPELKQKALMEVYKKEGINPLGGCLPLLLQMPFFFALFSVLPGIVELKHVSFLWIKDLSSPDTILRGNFMITHTINVLPILMTITSLIQSKISQGQGGDAKQQKMMMILPVVFLFIFWNMPSGLVLYWTIQNVVQILQQVWANKKIEKQKVLEVATADTGTSKARGKSKR